jgi:CspA family cold shock protein
MSKLQKGIVKWFNAEKGFGFIENKDGPDIFLHYSKIQSEGYKKVEEGERVFYELADCDKGPYAKVVFRTNVIDQQIKRAQKSVRDIYEHYLVEKVEEQRNDQVQNGKVCPDAQVAHLVLEAHRF